MRPQSRSTHRTKGTLVLLATALICLSLLSCTEKEAESLSEARMLLGTSCRITIFEADDESQTAMHAAFEAIAQVERLMSRNLESSEISQINASAGLGTPIEISEETSLVLAEALSIAALSAGRFDPTIGPLVSLWGITSEDPQVPDEQDIIQATGLISYEQVLLYPEGSAELSTAGMGLDLGGIAKGYAADAAKAVLLEHGIHSALINLGGNVLTLGTKSDGSPWKIGIQDPASSRGDYGMIISVADRAVVTSGTYERFFISDGVRYHHILDTRTGYPVDNRIDSVTIISESSMRADALSTAAFASGLEEGMRIIESIPSAEAVFLTKDRQVYLSSGISNDEIQLIGDQFSIIP